MQYFPSALKNAEKFLKELKEKPESYWMRRGEKMALELFFSMAKRVPAYKDFLKRNKINPQKINFFQDLDSVPLLNKENYLLNYPTEKLCWDGEFQSKQWMISSTSGSTGKPYYFPREKSQDEQFQYTAEMLFRECYDIHKKTTLFVDCFALGVWIGGMYMYQALKYLSDSGKYCMTVITPGAYKEEAIKAIDHLGQYFDQIVICGYAPLVKDLLDDGIAYGLDWKRYTVKFFFAAEAFSESFRDHIMKKCGLSDPYFSSFNHYGTADLGTMSHETPLSILVRRLSWEAKPLYQDLFRDVVKMPTLTQFIPELFFFQEIEGNLVCSSHSGMPLVRYDLKDLGRVFTLAEADNFFAEHGISLHEKIHEAGIDKKIWNVPFVSIFERRDLTANIYSVNIYPECIRRALERAELERFVTGKFTMRSLFDENENQYLEINTEMKTGVTADAKLEKKVKDSIVERLNEENSEWRDFYANPLIRNKVTPRIRFWEYQHAKHFKPGGKQKWIMK